MFKQQIELTELMGAKAPQELMLASKQVFYFERYVKGLAPDYQMMRDLYLTKNKIRRRRTSPLSGGLSSRPGAGTQVPMKAKNIDAPSKKAVQDWSDIAAQLDKGDFMSLDNDGPSHFTTWLTTINADGSPHVTAVGAVWDGDTFWFQTADRTRKAKNIVRDQRCAVSLTLDGCDVVVEGTAEKVTDPDDVARIAEIWAIRGGWPATPDEHGTGLTAPFNAPGLGSPPWFVYRITPAAATSVTQQGGSTRWTF